MYRDVKASIASPSTKREVKDIRKKGACLRCRLLKRACSGEDPCKTCISAARSAIGSRALMWMECIRPSFQAMNIFGGDYSSINQSHVDKIVSDLLNDDVYLDFHIPFELNVEAASAHLASWLADESGSSTFSVVGVFSCSTNTSLLENSLDPNLCRDLRLFVHLTTHLYTTGMQGGYHEYTDEEIQSARNCVGKRLLLALDPLLRPTELEIAEDKLGKLQSLFLLLLGTTIGMKYARREAANLTDNEIESKYEAISRLLCYYLIYIGKAASLLTAGSDEKTLVSRWESQWNKPAAFTWNPTRGFEMHYRIEPPADWIVSRSEDESMDSIDIDLTDFDQTEEFTMNTDLLKCAGCGSFWASLDVLGLCHECGPAFSSTGFGSEGSIPISDTCIYTSFSAHPDCTFNDVASPSWSMLECPKSFETLAIEKTTPAIDPQDSDS
ncbi:hypothetical protein CC78DRAFT_566768 [Lojkania enalia]|uniref:Zn(2)-C6 fungal-type domain-containing protein n=1 Tax=Lojkania enalia TaxID=147567 RepID=A0A9P4N212_9PLEO|nr:hypothetical protein CC78DRAFT_566768 [Didymosphaeria enalia]